MKWSFFGLGTAKGSMSFQISKLNRNLLIKIEPLLSASAGYQTSIPDELEFFDSTLPDSWFVALDENHKPVGFVRSFNQGEWSQGELFVVPMQERPLVATQLLENFLTENKFEFGHRLRFDIASSDAEFKSCIEQVGLNQKSQTFFYYELQLTARKSDREIRMDLVSASEVADALNSLHPVTVEEVKTWIKNESIRTISFEGKVVAAAQIFNYGDSAEINRIATNSIFLRRGFSKVLVQNICDELSAKGVERLFLKVENVRQPAIKFYENFGFIKNEEKTQTWFSKYF